MNSLIFLELAFLRIKAMEKLRTIFRRINCHGRRDVVGGAEGLETPTFSLRTLRVIDNDI